MTVETLITTNHKKGIHFLNVLVAPVYNGAKLDEDQAQYLNENDGNFQGELAGLIKKYSQNNQFADEEVYSNFAYPPEYKGPKSIKEQVEILLKYFPALDSEWALKNGQKWYDQLILPSWVEGPLVYVWRKAFGGYNATLEQILEKIQSIRKIHNYRSRKLGINYLRQHRQTIDAENAFKKHQPGDLIIVPSQAGLRWRGKSVRRSRVLYTRGEFGLGSVAESCRIISHPERFVRWEQLQVDCAGDEYTPRAGGDFSDAPCFGFYDGRVGFGASGVGVASDDYGSASAFLPQFDS